MPVSDERHTPDLGDADRRFIQRLAQHYTPRPLSAAKRVHFDRALEERLAATPRSLWLPAGILAGAALLLLVALPPLFTSRPTVPENLDGGPSTAGSQVPRVESHPTLLTLVYDQLDAEGDTNTGLPDEYVALAEALEL